MRECDVEQMKVFWNEWAARTAFSRHRIALLSPSPEEKELITKLFPDDERIILMKDDWDLNNEWGGEPFDLAVVSNILMYAKEPQRWIDNLLKASQHVWIQDNILGQRDPINELGSDGDAMRFSMLPDHPARLPQAFDLSHMKDRLWGFTTYKVPVHGKVAEAKAFLAWFGPSLV